MKESGRYTKQPGPKVWNGDAIRTLNREYNDQERNKEESLSV